MGLIRTDVFIQKQKNSLNIEVLILDKKILYR